MTEGAIEPSFGLKQMVLGVQIVLFGQFVFNDFERVPILIFGLAIGVAGLFVR